MKLLTVSQESDLALKHFTNIMLLFVHKVLRIIRNCGYKRKIVFVKIARNNCSSFSFPLVFSEHLGLGGGGTDAGVIIINNYLSTIYSDSVVIVKI